MPRRDFILKGKRLKLHKGQRYGRWTILDAKPFHKENIKTTSLYVKCQCTCGLVNDVLGSDLVSGRNCGCRSCVHIVDVCVNGHKIVEWGRSDTGSCRACIKNKSLFRTYGITLAEFLQLWEYQGRKCCICGSYLEMGIGGEGWNKGSRIEVDHLHGTDLPKKETVRGLLCGGRWAGCNRKLGRLDKPAWLKAAFNYVSDPPAYKLFNTNRELVIDEHELKDLDLSEMLLKGN